MSNLSFTVLPWWVFTHMPLFVKSLVIEFCDFVNMVWTHTVLKKKVLIFLVRKVNNTQSWRFFHSHWYRIPLMFPMSWVPLLPTLCRRKTWTLMFTYMRAHTHTHTHTHICMQKHTYVWTHRLIFHGRTGNTPIELIIIHQAHFNQVLNGQFILKNQETVTCKITINTTSFINVNFLQGEQMLRQHTFKSKTERKRVSYVS